MIFPAAITSSLAISKCVTALTVSLFHFYKTKSFALAFLIKSSAEIESLSVLIITINESQVSLG
jgi:hypothetical protein